MSTTVRNLVKKNQYQDSVRLMSVAARVKGLPGVTEASCVMGTPENLAILQRAGLLAADARAASPSDLVVALAAADAALATAALRQAEEWLEHDAKAASSGEAAGQCPRSLAAALEAAPDSNVVQLSVPGRYARREAERALAAGRHVFLFSDNVPLADEIALKRKARDRGLLVMGPDAGTAIIGGLGLGFANQVRRGHVGIVAASGTGIQEVSCLLDRLGEGISHAIGTGGNDRKDAVGGITMLQAIRVLEEDPATRLIVLLSKPPEANTAAKVLAAVQGCSKPFVIHFIGAPLPTTRLPARITFAPTLEDAALAACSSAPDPRERKLEQALLLRTATAQAAALPRGRRFLRGLYSGGTLAYEALHLLAPVLGDVHSNIPLRPDLKLADSSRSVGHAIVDLGEDEFTRGRPHPMIDFTLRNERILREAADHETAVLLFDVVLGYGAHPDPAAAMEPALRAARRKRIALVAAVCGTESDPQVYSRQVAALSALGVNVLCSNVAAVRFAGQVATASAAAGRATAKAGAKRGGDGSRGAGARRGGDSFGSDMTRGHVAAWSARPPARRAAKAEGGRPEAGEPAPAESNRRCAPPPPAARALQGSPKPRQTQAARGAAGLLARTPSVVNLGLDLFHHSLLVQGASSLHVDWRPPAADPAALARLDSPAVENANRAALERLISSEPVLVDVAPALEVIPGMTPTTILHAGPPIAWQRMCGPMRGAIVGALMYERLARTPRQAEKLAASGKIAFSPCHHHRTVGPMAGIVSASMWVWVVRNETFGNLAFCTLNEGLGKVLRFGANSPDVIARLRWMERTLAPALKKALARRGPVKLKSLIAQALQMGDECHNRNAAATSLFLKELMPRLLSAGLPQPDVRAVVEFIAGNGHFFLNLAMAASKATADTILGFAGSTLLAGMARNGVEIGIRIAGLGDRWFTAAAGIPKGLYFPGFSDADANPDLGDSTITETAGIGALAMACAPAIVQFVGGRPADAVATTMEMYGICAGEHPVFRIPYLDFRGTPVGVDVRKVADTGVTPVINTGIAHRDAGIGQVGAGLLRAPVELFAAAVEAFAQTQEGRRRGGDAWI